MPLPFGARVQRGAPAITRQVEGQHPAQNKQTRPDPENVFYRRQP